MQNDNFNNNFSDSGFGNISGVGVQKNNVVVVTNHSGDIYRRDPNTLTGITNDDIGADISTLKIRKDNTVFVAGDFGGGSLNQIGIRTVNINGWTAVSPQGGFGETRPNAVGIQSNNRPVLGNTGGTMRIRDANDMDTGIVTDGGFGLVTAIDIQSNDRVVVGNNEGNLYIRQSNVSSGVESDGGFGHVAEIRILADNNLVVASNYDDGTAFVRIREGNDQNNNSGDIGGIAGMSWANEFVTAIALQSDGDIVAGFSNGRIRLLRNNGGGGFNVLQDEGGYGSITDLAVLVPEPSALVLAALAVPFVLRRHRRR